MKQKKTEISHKIPVVVVLGHVDHGKTSLLDYIRRTRIARKEAGGITQHIGAYLAEVKVGKQTQHLTFIDTPGHAVFSNMRSRGGQVADLAILVIAGNEGIKPQTKESLQYIQQSNIPYLVAVTKMDLENFNLEMVKNQLMELGQVPEDRGGDVMVVPVSSVTGQGIDQLMESLWLLAELAELKADPQAVPLATVIESHLDKRRGVLATVVVEQGTFRPRMEIYANGIKSKIRALMDETGRQVKQALPGMAVQILGWQALPPVGARVSTDESLVKNRESAQQRLGKAGTKKAEDELNIVLKCDTSGTLEALTKVLPEGVNLISAGVGEITESDIEHAKISHARVVGFHIPVSTPARNLAEIEHVTVVQFDVVYELLNYLETEVKRLVDPYFDKQILGKAEVLQVFTINKQRIAGCKVIEGVVVNKAQVDFYRQDQLYATAKIVSLHKGKQAVEKVEKNQECGLAVQPFVGFQAGDQIICYKNKTKSI